MIVLRGGFCGVDLSLREEWLGGGGGLYLYGTFGRVVIQASKCCYHLSLGRNRFHSILSCPFVVRPRAFGIVTLLCIE